MNHLQSDPYLVTPHLVTPLFSDTIFFPHQNFDKIFIKISNFLFSLPAVWKRDLMSFLSFPLSHSPYQGYLRGHVTIVHCPEYLVRQTVT